MFHLEKEVDGVYCTDGLPEFEIKRDVAIERDCAQFEVARQSGSQCTFNLALIELAFMQMQKSDCDNSLILLLHKRPKKYIG